MACLHPVYARKLYTDRNGKVHIKFITNKPFPGEWPEGFIFRMEQIYGKDNILSIPCGKCLACKLDYAREWAIRCTLELPYHDCNSFVTLTYDDVHLPRVPTAKFFSGMIRKMRKDGIKVSYFGCSEFGSKTNRFHHHAILFGYEPNDLKRFSYDPESCCYTYTSDSFSKYWPYGHVLFGEARYESCSYVARYVTKKVDKKSFIMVSCRPAIGRKYFDDHFIDIYSKDKIYGKFGPLKYVTPPRYYDKLLKEKDIFLYEIVKEFRSENSQLLDSAKVLDSGVNREKFLSLQEVKLNDRIKSLKRKL